MTTSPRSHAAKRAIVEANSELFGAFFTKPHFRQALLDYLAGSYDQIRADSTS